MLTAFHIALLAAIKEHGPLTYNEVAAALRCQSQWSDVNNAIDWLERGGYVVVFHDERVRLTALGRRQSQGAKHA